MKLAALAILAAVALVLNGFAAGGDALVFSFFRSNGETGVFLASSTDGLTWRPLNGDQPVLKPAVGESRLTRDPSIAQGPDGRFHMVWTTAWKGRTIGYAWSKNLRDWSTQRALLVFPDGTDVLNCWAPEVFYDRASREFVVVWASTIRGQFPATLGSAGPEYNHRLYAFRTKDFETISPAKLFYDPGFIVIDGAIFQFGKRYMMVVKNETQTPPAKYLFLTSADSLAGPWSAPGERLTGPEWSEGASPLQVGGAWYIYFDQYRKHQYGAIRSKDLKTWEDVSDKVSFPAGIRHGTAFYAPKSIVTGLLVE